MNHPLAELQAQRYRDYQRQRQMTLSDLLLDNRIIFLGGTYEYQEPRGIISDLLANITVMKLLHLQAENRHQDIHLYINSPGGSVTATLAIYDAMQYVSCPIATYCVGQAASGAAILLAGGAKEKRFALPHAKVMIHQPWGTVGGQVSDIEIQAEDIVKTRDRLNEILAKHTGQPIERIAKDTQRDRIMNSGEAKEYGLIDEVLTGESQEGKEEKKS
jgi:ATP-dependent Clp protease protease subunit